MKIKVSFSFFNLFKKKLWGVGFGGGGGFRKLRERFFGYVVFGIDPR